MSKSEFEKLLNQATSPGNLEPDWVSFLSLCDILKRKDKDTIKVKDAIALIKKKILDKNHAVSLNGLHVIEACMKNCGTSVHRETLDRAFLDDLHDLAKAGCPTQVKDKIVELIAAWDGALGSDSVYRAVRDTYSVMKLEGFNFPALKESDILLDSEAAPDWVDDKSSSTCHMCRSQFGKVMNRKHHCRNCGNIFCQQCSSKKARIPKFGFEEEVRVCDLCFRKLTGESTLSSTLGGSDEGELPPEYLRSSLARESQEPQSNPQNSEEEMKQQEEEELQIAMALSLSEKEAQPSTSSTNYFAPPASAPPSSSYYTPPVTQTVREPEPYVPAASRDPELARYEDREYWEQRRARQQEQLAHEYEMPDVTASASRMSQLQAAAAPIAAAPPPTAAVAEALPTSYEALGHEEGDSEDMKTLADSMQNTIDMFCNRIRQISSMGRSIALDASVQSLFHSLNAMHPQLLKHIEDQEESKGQFEDLQKKLHGSKEARASLNSMRRAYQKKKREMEEEREMLARLQVQQKLELMRQQRREEENHQEMLRESRQKEIDLKMKQQEQEAQQRFLLHQQRQMQLHLSVQAEQQSQFSTYAPAAGMEPSLESYPVESHYEPPSEMARFSTDVHPYSVVEPMKFGPGAAAQQEFVAPDDSFSMSFPVSGHQGGQPGPSALEMVAPSYQQQEPAPFYSTSSSLQPSYQQSMKPQYHQQSQLQPGDGYMPSYSPPTQRALHQEPHFVPSQQQQYQQPYQPQQHPASFPVAPLQTGHQPSLAPPTKSEAQLISFD
eukprot:m.308022 g.308022  ORF g.308022 m.308022 type:complete len:780 (+) comp43269_c0_seq1:89-2428(+)